MTIDVDMHASPCVIFGKIYTLNNPDHLSQLHGLKFNFNTALKLFSTNSS